MKVNRIQRVGDTLLVSFGARLSPDEYKAVQELMEECGAYVVGEWADTLGSGLTDEKKEAMWQAIKARVWPDE